MRRVLWVFWLILAALFVWWAFFRKVSTIPVNPVTGRAVGTSADIKATANNAVATTIQTASNAAQPGVAAITGVIVNGIAQSLSNAGGAFSSSTSAGDGAYVDGSSSDYSTSDDLAVDSTM